MGQHLSADSAYLPSAWRRQLVENQTYVAYRNAGDRDDPFDHPFRQPYSACGVHGGES